MFKIDSPGNDNGQFVDEDELNAIPGTEVSAEYMNAVQAEIINVIEAAGITLDKTQNNQLLAAIRRMVDGVDLIVRYTTTGNVVASGLAVQAGGDWAAPLTAGNFILLKNQTIPEDNGWFIAAPGTWPRIPYLDSSAEIQPGKLTKVTEGVTLHDSLWMLTTDAPIVLNSSALNFERKDQAFSQSQADARYVGKQYMILQDEKSAGTNAGASNTGMNIRTLNTVSFNSISGASLSANQITLPAGIYRITGRAPAAKCDTHKAYFYNVTDNIISIVGASVNASAAGTSDQVYTDSWFEGRLILNATKVFELRHWILTGAGTDGLGANCNFPGLIEVYAQLKIIREGD